MSKHNILVIGSSGQVASCLKEFVKEEFLFIGRPDFDICDKVQLLNFIDDFKPHLIINTSAYTAVDLAEKEIELAYLLNGEAVKNLSIKCSLENIPLIHISTDYVYDGKKTTPYLETDQTNPLSIYGKSKLVGEDNVRNYVKNHIILRTSWIFSQYGMNFVTTMIKSAKNSKQVYVVNDQYGSPTAGINLAKVIVQISDKILNTPQNIYGTYNYSDYPVVSWYEFANHIFMILNNEYKLNPPLLASITTDEYKALATRPANSILDYTLINKNFQIKPYNWISELEKCIKKLI